MLMYYYAGAWRVASSNLPDAGGQLQGLSSSGSIPTDLTTAGDLFWWCYKERCHWDLPPSRAQHICFVFEMMTELNTVVVRNKYQPNPLVCIGLRDCNTLHELPASADTLLSLGCGHMLTAREFDILPTPRSDPEECLHAVVEAARKLNPMQQVISGKDGAYVALCGRIKRDNESRLG